MTTIARTMMTTHRSRVLLRVRNAATPYTFVGPIVALAFFFYFVPIFGAFNLSLKRWLITTGRDPEFIGFENYIELFSDQYFYGAFWNTVQFVIGLVPIGIVLSLGLALLLNLPIRFRAGFRAIFFIPVVIPTVVVAMIWSFMFAPYGGVINGLLESLGFQAINLAFQSRHGNEWDHCCKLMEGRWFQHGDFFGGPAEHSTRVLRGGDDRWSHVSEKFFLHYFTTLEADDVVRCCYRDDSFVSGIHASLRDDWRRPGL